VSFSIFCGFLPLKCPRLLGLGEFSEAATHNRPTWPLVVAVPPAAPRRLRVHRRLHLHLQTFNNWERRGRRRLPGLPVVRLRDGVPPAPPVPSRFISNGGRCCISGAMASWLLFSKTCLVRLREYRRSCAVLLVALRNKLRLDLNFEKKSGRN
jgi:hypothetical protein